MSSVNSADKEKVFAVYLVVFLLLAFEVAVSRNSPAKKKAGVKNQLFLLLAF